MHVSYCKCLISLPALLLLPISLLRARKKFTENTFEWTGEQAQRYVAASNFKMLKGYWFGRGLKGQCEANWSSMKDSVM